MVAYVGVVVGRLDIRTQHALGYDTIDNSLGMDEEWVVHLGYLCKDYWVVSRIGSCYYL